MQMKHITEVNLVWWENSDWEKGWEDIVGLDVLLYFTEKQIHMYKVVMLKWAELISLEQYNKTKLGERNTIKCLWPYIMYSTFA